MIRLFVAALLLLTGCARRDYDGMCKLATEILGEPRVTPGMRFARFVADAPNSAFGGGRRRLIANLPSVAPELRYDFVRAGAAEDGLIDWSCPALPSVLNPPAEK